MSTLSPSDIQYMEEHVKDSRVPGMIATTIVCAIASILAIGLRLLARRLASLHLKADDWWIIVSLVFC